MTGRSVSRVIVRLGLAVCLTAAVAPAATLGILPLANHTGRGEARAAVAAGLHARLRQAGVTIRTAEQLRPMLRKHRIRAMGQIGAADASLLRDEAGVDMLLLGSIDVYDEPSLEVAISLRLLDLHRLELVAAVSTATAGEDFAGLFDTAGESRP